jgi:hypothetical protein
VTRKEYLQLAGHAGKWLLRPTPGLWLIGVDRVPSASHAIYIVFDRQGEVSYVGSTARPGNPEALGQRLREHLRARAKAFTWHAAAAILLRKEVPRSQVLKIESLVAFDLKPSTGRRPRHWRE